MLKPANKAQEAPPAASAPTPMLPCFLHLRCPQNGNVPQAHWLHEWLYPNPKAGPWASTVPGPLLFQGQKRSTSQDLKNRFAVHFPYPGHLPADVSLSPPEGGSDCSLATQGVDQT